MQFKNKVVVITGAGKGIGRQIAQDFLDNGAIVCSISRTGQTYYQGDIGDKKVLEEFYIKVINEHGKIDYLINNAPPIMKGLDDATYEDGLEALKVGSLAAFYLAKLFKDDFNQNGAIINISSTRAKMSQAQSETYAMAKGAISALTHSLAQSLSGKVRVNTILPGWIDTSGQEFSGPDASQHTSGRVGNPKDISSLVLYLCSDKAGFINGQEFIVDGGMSTTMIYSGDEGWQLNK